MTPRRRSWSNSSSRRPAVWNKPPPLWARRGSFLKSGACSSLLSSGSHASSASSGPGHASTSLVRRVAASVPSGLAGTLEDLLVVKPDENTSGLQAIKANPSKPSVDAMLTLLDKLRVIEATGVLGVDLSWLNGNYQRALFHQVRKTSVTRLRELAESRRHAALVCFLWQSYRDAVDQTVDMFDKLLTRAHTQAQNELDEQLCHQRQTIQISLTALRSLGKIILDDEISDEELRARLFAVVSREELVACMDNTGEWVTGKRSDLFHGIVRRHGMLRKFSPAWLDALELTQDIEGEQSACLRALQMLKELNATGRRSYRKMRRPTSYRNALNP